MDWVRRITEYMRSRGEYEFLYTKMKKAERICRSLCEKYNGAMLLHGDLHHDNILLGEDKRYRVIDPKGVIGDAVFDIPRYILNEFDGDIHKKYAHVARTLSDNLSVPEHDIRRLVYVETCMANCWCVEDGDEPNMSDVALAETAMEEIL